MGVEYFDLPYGFVVFGGGDEPSPVTVRVATETAVLLSIPNPELGDRAGVGEDLQEDARRIVEELAKIPAFQVTHDLMWYQEGL